MRWFPRILIALFVLVSGLALTPRVALPMQRFGWQLFADVYEPTPVDVSIEDFAFTPATILIEVGTRVRWTNNDPTQHTVTSFTGVFDSGILEPGGSFEHVFDVPGTYPYECTLHPTMRGTIIVAEQITRFHMPVIMKNY